MEDTGNRYTLVEGLVVGKDKFVKVSEKTFSQLQEAFGLLQSVDSEKFGYVLTDGDVIFGYKNVPNRVLGQLLLGEPLVG